MYCSRCGKKVLDSMLYCPFCGAEIIIPEQEPYDGAAEPEPVKVEPVFSFELPEESAPEPAVKAQAPETVLPWEEEQDEPEAPDPQPEPEPEPEPEAEPEKEVAEAPEPATDGEAFEKPPVERRHVHLGSVVPGRRSEETRVPDRTTMFMDDEDDFDDAPDAFDDFEEQVEQQTRRSRRERRKKERLDAEDEDAFDDFEEEVERQTRKRRRDSQPVRSFEPDDDEDDFDDDSEEPSFIFRHIRSIVGILLFVVLLAILGFYALSDSGQMQLARINATLPLRPEIYSRVAFEHYQASDYALSGRYYERALARDPDNYNYASSAAMAYLAGGNNDRAAEMLRKCAQIRPEAVEPYVYLLNLYPNANSRPWDVAQLLKQGYKLTGDERLKEAADAVA